MAPQLTMFMGLPGSGKSTVAKARIKDNPNSIKRVNKDDLRAMMDAGHWSKGNEKFVLQIRDHIIREALAAGKHVICDDTNLHPKHEQQLRQIAKECGAGFHINKAFLDVSVEECIKRDLQRMDSVGEKVIRSMYDAFLKPEPVVYEPPEGKPRAVIVDIDGTLAHMTTRSPYEWDRVGEDEIDPDVREITNFNHGLGNQVILLSGRDGSCRYQTEKWLAENHVFYDDLHMREADDMRKDTVVKKEMFDKHVRDNYRVQYVIDDRPVVCRMWREEIGLKVIQVGDPYKEF